MSPETPGDTALRAEETAPAPTVVLPRAGGPPLRLRAALAHEVRVGSAETPLARVALWRRTGRSGWAVAAEWRLAGALRREARLATDLEAAAVALEAICAKACEDVAQGTRGPRPERGDALRRLGRAVAGRRALLALEEAVGAALADWATAAAGEAGR